jgi:hypothetical protein
MRIERLVRPFTFVGDDLLHRSAGDGDHVLPHGFSEPDAGIETLRDDIDGAAFYAARN